ncbi:metal ABC transporter permease [Chloroflexales bacterium ZM16-3]|nr:metal ABC transporter permease [Chloroflexales bacterium ZM16-3]
MLEFLTAPLVYPFMQRGLLAAVMVGVVCAVVGTYVVLRGMAFFGDALSHTILPGIAAGYLLNGGDRGALFWWALVTAVASSLGIGAISRGAKLREDTAIGVVFAGMFALGIAMISTVRSYSADLTHFLFGDVLGVGDGDLLRIGIFGGLILLTVILLYKELMLLSFDSILATTLRLPVQALEYLLLVLIAVAVVVSIQTVGVSLMLAVLVTPAATASLLTRRLGPMLVLAAGMAAACGVVGLYISYYLGVASGAAIVLTCTALFLLTWAGSWLRGSRAKS